MWTETSESPHVASRQAYLDANGYGTVGTACKKLTQGTQGLAWLRPLSIVASPAPNSPPTPRVNWTEAPPLTV